jgi:undecaprenyl-diphosphatase
VVVAGLAFHDFISGAARNPGLVAAASIGFGVLLWVADRRGRRGRSLGSLVLGDALWIGLAQALALVPGTSRSGITITAALLLGFDRPAAARISFLLAIPVGLLAAAKDGLDLVHQGAAVDWLPLALGTAVAAVSAYLVIGGLLAWLKRQTMTPFVVYRILLGVAILAVLGARL